MCATRSRPATTAACTRCSSATTRRCRRTTLLARIAALNADPRDPRHPGADAAAQAPRRTPCHRSHRPGQGCRWLLGRQRGRADDRPARPASGHAAGLHEADRNARVSACAASTPWSSAAATPSASRWRCCCCRPTRPSRCATAQRPISPLHTRQADIVVAAVGPPQHPHGRDGQARRGHHRRRHQPQRRRQALRRRRLRRRLAGRGLDHRRYPAASAR